MPSEELRGVAMRYYSSFSCSSLFLLHRNFRPSADEPDLTKRERDGRMRGRRTRGEGNLTDRPFGRVYRAVPYGSFLNRKCRPVSDLPPPTIRG